MSKRYVMFPMHGEAKKAKLDISISDHNFPMSQNKQDSGNDWGDDNEDELLLLASQACEAYTDNDIIHSLPDYDQFSQPQLASTPFEPQPSTSNPTFAFKIPSSSPSNSVLSTTLKNRYNGIAPPLHGMNYSNTRNTSDRDDFIVNNNVSKDYGHIYKQLMAFRDENSKLKLENGKLLEKCVTNDGEVSILRSQLKTCQVAVDNARMERVKVQERVQMEYSEKLGASKNELGDLRSQLDFKNLEIVSLKERCKMLESSKIRMTQVTVAGNDISMSQRINSTTISNNIQSKRKAVSSATQTEIKKDYIKLNKRLYFGEQKLKHVFSLILQETEKQMSLLHYNEKLRKSHDVSQTKCRIFSTFHGIPTMLSSSNRNIKKLSLNNIYEDLSFIASTNCFCEGLRFRYTNIFKQIRNIYLQLMNELESVSHRLTAAFQREMDEKYIEATSTFFDIHTNDLFNGKSLYKDEQSILSRRATAILSYTITCETTANIWYTLTGSNDVKNSSDEQNDHSITLLCKICKLIDRASCAVLYSGFLLSLIILIQNIYKYLNISELYEKLIVIVKCIVTARAMPIVVCNLLRVLRYVSLEKKFLKDFCMKNATGNLKLDYDHGVMLFKNESCIMQIFLKQIETSLKAIETENKIEQLVVTTQNLLGLYGNISSNDQNWAQEHRSNRCDCAIIMMQVIVYSLHICAYVLRSTTECRLKNELLCICGNGIKLLYQWVLRDVEFSTQLGFYEGHYHIFIENCEFMKDMIVSDEIQGNMLSELVCTLQPGCDDLELPTSNGKEVWLESFDKFSISD